MIVCIKSKDYSRIRGCELWIMFLLCGTIAVAQTNTFPASGNVGIGTTTPGNTLSVNGVINAGGNYYNVLSYNLNSTPVNGVKIKTNLPFANWSQMSTIIIEGYDYGWAETIGLTISWYIYNGAFYSYTASSSGGYVPQIELSDESGNVVIYINDKPYFQRFTVRAYAQGITESPSWFNGWSVVDEALSGTNTVTVPYQNSFAGNVSFPGNGVWNASGNVGIGTTTPSATLEVNGSVKLTANSGSSIIFPDNTSQTTSWTGVLCGGDYAEAVDISDDHTQYGPGDVLVIDPNVSGRFLKSAEPYSTAVTGIYSTKPGAVGRRQSVPKSLDEVPMAMIGIVPAKVSAENGAIHRGDLLVTSSTPGYAMKGTDRTRLTGAVLGKALDNLENGTGIIEIAVTLQ